MENKRELLKNERIGFIGVGNMGEALLKGILSSSLVPSDSIFANDIDTEKLSNLSSELGINTVGSNKELVESSSIILLALKPNVIMKVVSEISTVLNKPKWCISIAAGVRIADIESLLNADVPVVRVMPNTPAMVREGMSAICGGKNADETHISKARCIFESVGRIILVQEKLMDAVTALSGSGPAFVFLVIESLTDAGVQLGFSHADASLMAVQTVLGASKMVMETGEHPAILRNKVTSPGGTTAAGLYEMERGGVRAAIIDAVVSATNRSKQISSENN